MNKFIFTLIFIFTSVKVSWGENITIVCKGKQTIQKIRGGGENEITKSYVFVNNTWVVEDKLNHYVKCDSFSENLIKCKVKPRNQEKSTKEETEIYVDRVLGNISENYTYENSDAVYFDEKREFKGTCEKIQKNKF